MTFTDLPITAVHDKAAAERSKRGVDLFEAGGDAQVRLDMVEGPLDVQASISPFQLSRYIAIWPMLIDETITSDVILRSYWKLPGLLASLNDEPRNIIRLRQRNLGGERNLALREFALGHEALKRFFAREPLRRVHECVFAVLALESEPIDPRL
jgi:hypothetical protein